jgi:flavin-dependent dehydrogenase
MQSANHYDVIIVGAGPAGISTALHLAQIAPHLISRTLILEKARHPRPKLCAGGVLIDAEVVLRSLGLDIAESPHLDVDWVHFDFDGQGMRMRAEKTGTFALRTVRRHEFDAWLAAQARARGFLIQENTAVKRVTVSGSGVRLETDKGEYRAKVVVGADGSNSIVRRAIVTHDDLHVARVLEVVTGPLPEKSPNKEMDSYFDFVVIPQGIAGYVWDFAAVEKGKPVRVRGVYDSNLHSGTPKVSLREALAVEFRRHGLDLEDYQLEGFPIRWFDAKGTFAAPRVLLAGDAAGVDAIFGEGISTALGYGGFAARAIQDAFARKDFSFGGYKRSILRSGMGKALSLRTGVARFLYAIRWPAFQAFLWQRMGWLIAWFVRAFVIGWAQRDEKHNA